MSPLLAEHDKLGISAEREKHLRAAVTKLAPAFIPNAGQAASDARFIARGAGYGFYFTPAAVNMAFFERSANPPNSGRRLRRFRTDELWPEREQAGRGMALSLKFIDSNPAASIEGHQEQPGVVNFIIGNDPAKWLTNLHSYAKIVYSELWPGIDLVFRKTGGILKYEFILQPGADIRNIRLTYDGADGLALDADGNLLVHTPLGILTEQRPESYKLDGGQHLPVATDFILAGRTGDTCRFGFTAGAGYDPACPLVIDPSLVYSTFLSGGADEGYSVTADAAGNAYVTGFTLSEAFPTTADAYQPIYGGGTYDAFVSKLNSAGSALVYSTYLGGSSDDIGSAIAIDDAGNAYVTGYTQSNNFPTTPDAYRPNRIGSYDAFVTKLNPAGSDLVYSTYLGGSSGDYGIGIAVNADGNAFVTGWTTSTNFPVTEDAHQTTYGGGASDAFVSKLNPAGSDLVYSTYLGGSGGDYGRDIAVDADGNAYVAGYTESATDFPVTPGAFQTTYGGGDDSVFISKLNTAGSALVYSTYLGGSGQYNEGYGIAADSDGNAYITGWTTSTDFPITPGAFQTVYGGGGDGNGDAFVSKLNTAGSALVYSTYLGGSGDDTSLRIAVDAAGYAYVAGRTNSLDFPLTADAYQTTYGGGYYDAFVARLNPAGSALIYSTYFGGSGWDEAWGVAADATGNIYISGETDSSTDFPTTPDAFQPTFISGYGDNFVAKLSTPTGCGLILADPDCRRSFGLDMPNGPNNPVPDYVCHDVCVQEVVMIASQEVHQRIPYPPIGLCRLGPDISLPLLAPDQQCGLFVTCAGGVLGSDCASAINTIGLLTTCISPTGSVVAVPFTITLTFSTFYDFPSGARLYYSQVQRRMREIDGSCKIIQLRATVNGDGSAILIDGKIVDKLWKHENLWLSGLRPYDLDQSQRDQGFVSLTVGSAFANFNQEIIPCP